MSRYSLALVAALLLGVFSQLALKRVSVEVLPSMLALPEWLLVGTVWQHVKASMETMWLWYLLLAFALSTYALSVGAWLVALQRFELGRAYPFLSLGYVLVYLFAVFWPGLNESVSWSKSAGIVLILTGVTLCMHRPNVGQRDNASNHSVCADNVFRPGKA